MIRTLWVIREALFLFLPISLLKMEPNFVIKPLKVAVSRRNPSVGNVWFY